MSTTSATGAALPSAPKTSFWILCAVSSSHFLNDLMQALLPAIYPLLRDAYALDFAQIGMITLVNQFTASLLQPLVGLYTDKRPQPYSLPIAMCSTLAGLLVLARADGFAQLLLAAALIGIGSAIFHPEASRVSRMASGGRLGFAQAFFQVGGSLGTAIGPLMAAFIILPRGQGTISWFALVALTAIILLATVGRWYSGQNRRPRAPVAARDPSIGRRDLVVALIAIGLLVTAKNVYVAAMMSYYGFFLMERFALDAGTAQINLFLFLGAVAVGTFFGGPATDRFGRRAVIWVSMVGPLPFALAMPYVPLPATIALTIIIGLVMASAFSALVVYAQELLPGKVGLVSGMMFGVAFGMGALGAALLGLVADWHGMEFVFRLIAFLPLLGFLTILLPRKIR
ncbi:MFS transporter [Pelagibacterium montanilacus]|uniref:MFS transporter n=1 Tax=Pelagibacterium montanilacus TaxID=2185280 RepID=UPI000F8D1D16|nr:MFS transporter [Pelagibacterium montanilacus]